ncbi:vWA domain-containing protein [Corynebacterium sp.]|uniref:vWA domain-containing protein n=1 Tax=Corynebacterium sp. TaxID=1720 RepID=UPI0026DAC1B8|nr:vWA domain-containing protein [Corynebacterium sp.]MDO5033089.1 vWA domain-containing protein [Corynebacterium sp.]
MLSRNVKKNLTRAFAAATAAVLAGFGGSLGATAQEAPQKTEALSEVSQKNLSDFGSCISSEKSADLLFVLDQSASLVGYQGSKPTDSEHFRVDATEDLIKQLATLGEDNQAEINVKLAGFGSEYYSDPAEYGDWTNVAGNAEALGDQLAKFKEEDRVADLETDYGAAYRGALKEFGAHEGSSCRAIVFFTDGKFYTDEAANDLRGAQDALCVPNSSVSAFRNSNIRLFNVGLVPAAEASEQVAQLSRMAEGEDCGQGAPNGAFFDAGEDPAALFAAFRNLIPTSGGVSKDGTFRDTFDFVLDNSVSPVRLSAVPKTSVEPGTLVPTLTGPDGKTVELSPETTEVAGAKVKVSSNDRLPGMVDVSMERGGEENWAGKWTFGYKVADGAEGEYLATMVMIPGLTLDLKREDGSKVAGGINSDEVLKAQLVDGSGAPRSLEGKATLHAEFVTESGESTTLVDNVDIVDGNPVDVPLEAVEKAAAGALVTRVDVTTKGVDDQPGTALNPINAQTPLTITPVNMPSVGSAQMVSMTEKEITVDVPVSGPGKVWVADQSIDSGAGTLPEGVASLEVSSPNNTEDSALELGKDEQGSIPVTLRVENMADGPLKVEPVITLQSAEDNQQVELPLSLKGSMTTPLSKSAFGVAFVLAVLLGLLIPLGVMYFMKWFSGRIPQQPRMFVKTIPVAREGTKLIRTDNGKPFSVSKDEFQGAVPAKTQARSAQLGSHEAKVKLGLSPFTPAQVEVQREGTISGKGKKNGTRAVLPLALQNSWFLVGNAKDRERGEIVMTVDTLAQAATYDDMSQEISRQAPQLFDQVDFPAPKEPTAPQGPQQPQAPQPQQPFPGGFGGPGTGGPGQQRQPGQAGGFGRPGQPGQPGGFGQPGQPGQSGGFGQPGPGSSGSSGNSGGWPTNPGFGPSN